MSAGVFRIEPQSRRIEQIGTAPKTRETLAHVLSQGWWLPIEICELGIDVPAVGARKDDVLQAQLVVATGPQPALTTNEAGVYWVRGVPVTGRALISAQMNGAGPVGQSLADPTRLLNLPWSVGEALALIEWERAPDADAPKPYDLAGLESYLKFMSEAAAPVYEGGGCLRLYAVDPFGVDAGAVNFLPTDVQGMRRYALDCFDRRQSVQHEMAVRATASFGAVTETPPVGLWAVPTDKEPDADFAITGPERHLGKLTASRGQSYDKRLAKYKPTRVWLPGIPTWLNSTPQIVTWARIAG